MENAARHLQRQDLLTNPELLKPGPAGLGAYQPDRGLHLEQRACPEHQCPTTEFCARKKDRINITQKMFIFYNHLKRFAKTLNHQPFSKRTTVQRRPAACPDTNGIQIYRERL